MGGHGYSSLSVFCLIFFAGSFSTLDLFGSFQSNFSHCTADGSIPYITCILGNKAIRGMLSV